MQEVTELGPLGPTWFNTAIKSLTIMASSDQLVSSSSLAEELDVESSFIRKVLAKLMNDNLVESIGGRYGGYRLTSEVSKITIYDIYLDFTKETYIKEKVMLTNKTDQFFAKIISEAEVQLSEVLNNYTIDDLLETWSDNRHE